MIGWIHLLVDGGDASVECATVVVILLGFLLLDISMKCVFVRMPKDCSL
jgi:hypothetical protein